MSLLALSGTNSVSGGYDIDNSCKFEPDNTEYLVKTPSSDGNRRTFTTSMWVKRTELGAHMTLFGAQPSSGWTNGNTFQFGFTNDDKFQCGLQTIYVVQTNRVFRDTSAWSHIVVAVDTTQSTVANRFKLYINGVQETSWSVDQIYGISQNQDLGINHTTRHQIGRLIQNGWGFAGYIAEMHNVDGQQLAPTSFGEFDEDSGIWKPKAYTGTYGTNGFYLDFADGADLGDDESGNGNDYTETNITAADQATDTPTNNFATWNVLDITRTNTQGVDMLEGAMSIKHRSANGWTGTCSNIAISKGKWYWEAEVRVTNGASMWGAYPVATRQANVFFDTYIGGSAAAGYDSGAAFYDNDDAYYHDNTATNCTISGSTFNTVTGDVIMIAVDMDNNKLYAGVNGNWCNSSDNTLPNATGITISDEPHYLAAATYDANTTNSYNFGGFTTDTISSGNTDGNGYGTFEYAPPSGYYALCTKNLALYGGTA
jgi:hypothetical protein